ncbi:MAG: transferrin-binding protein-like solute binding protein [Neisseriaceae bacterium]|nr:transferrin-binding protein-like solute binding protein [Neisseriaceae bacterium]
MKRTFALVATLSLLTLTACGGGSDSPVAVNQPTNSGNPVVNPNQQLDYDYVVFKNGTNTNADHDDGYPQNRLNIMNLDGRNIEILPPNVSGSIVETYEGSTGIRRTVGGNLSYARYGVISYEKEKKDYSFYQGIPSASIPKTGTATYKGGAVAFRPADRAVSKGTSSFNVDFAQKTVVGEIDTEKFGKVSLNGGIKEDWGGFGGGNFQGAFYGDNAAEMAGEFTRHDTSNPKNDIYGTFGAKKQ